MGNRAWLQCFISLVLVCGLGALPLFADFDSDRKSDVAVWRPSEGKWYIIPSSTGQSYDVHWGGPVDTPVIGDFDGDGKTDVAVWRSFGRQVVYPFRATPVNRIACCGEVQATFR